MLAACSRDDGSSRSADTASPTPTLFAATPTVPGIARPPQTPQLGAGTATPRTRAEAFLRRIAPTDADLPASFTPGPLPAFEEGPQQGVTSVEPVLTYVTTFQGEGGPPVPPGGKVLQVRHTGYAFSDQQAAAGWLGEVAPRLREAAAAGTSRNPGPPRTERVDDIMLGDQSVAWRASTPALGSPEVDYIVWIVAVRRGSTVSELRVDGVGEAADLLARDLARRLDQRMVAALAAGAWP